MKRLLDKVDEMRKQRCKLVETLKADLDADDITKKALTERELDPQVMSRAYASHQKNIECSKRI